MLNFLSKNAYAVAAFMIILCTGLGFVNAFFGGISVLTVSLVVGGWWLITLLLLGLKERGMSIPRVGVWGFVAILWLVFNTNNISLAFLAGDMSGTLLHALFWLLAAAALCSLCHAGLRNRHLG